MYINIIETKGAIKNGHSRETGNIEYTKYKTKTIKTKNTTQYVLDTYTQASTNNIIKTWALLQIT